MNSTYQQNQQPFHIFLLEFVLPLDTLKITCELSKDLVHLVSIFFLLIAGLSHFWTSIFFLIFPMKYKVVVQDERSLADLHANFSAIN